MDFSGVDFLTFSPHKFYGLNGTGVLLNQTNHKITPLIHGGKSTTNYRSGTPCTANIIALAKALEIAMKHQEERFCYVSKLNAFLRSRFSQNQKIHINSPENAVPNILNISLIGMDRKTILEELEKQEIYLSTSTACSFEQSSSKAVFTITGDENLAQTSIRISLSHLTKTEELEKLCEILENSLLSSESTF